MTVSEDPMLWEGLVFSKHITNTQFLKLPAEVLADSAIFGEYVWLVQGYCESEKYLDDIIVPLLCSTCYSVAMEEALKCYNRTHGIFKFQSVMVFRYPRETMRDQNEIRQPRREELAKLVEKAVQQHKKPLRKSRCVPGLEEQLT